MKQFSVVPFWDSRAMKSDKTSRIMLTINLNRQQFRLSIKLYSTKDEFEKAVYGRKLNELQVELKQNIVSYVSKAETILKRLPNPDKASFVRLFKSEANFATSERTDIFPFFKIEHEQLQAEKRFGPAHNVLSAWNSIMKYVMYRKDGLSIEQRELLKQTTNYVEPVVEYAFEEIDEKFLKAYHVYMGERGCADATVGIYIGILKRIYGKAIDDGIVVGKEKSPFDDFKLSSPERTKAVLYPEQLEMLYNYTPVGIREKRGKAFFFLCYLLNGMNFKDVAQLKWKNFSGDVLTFVRQKTKRSRKKPKSIPVHVHEEAWKIINEFGVAERSPDAYIFPWYSNCRDAKHFNDTINRYKKVSNGSLKKIGKKLGFEVNLTLSLARHSFATKHKLDGTPVAFISEWMGHCRTEVTEHYLKSLPSEMLKLANTGLLNFATNKSIKK